MVSASADEFSPSPAVMLLLLLMLQPRLLPPWRKGRAPLTRPPRGFPCDAFWRVMGCGDQKVLSTVRQNAETAFSLYFEVYLSILE